MSNETKTPDHLPPVPEGYVYAGMGEDLPPKENDGSWRRLGWGSRKWARTAFKGGVSNWHHYAVPTTSGLGRKILAEQEKPSWGLFPDDAKWRAQDASGEWWAYWGKPEPDEGQQAFDYPRPRRGPEEYEMVVVGEPNPNWRETLERRPERKPMSVEECAEWAKGVADEMFKDEGVDCPDGWRGKPDLIIPANIAEELSDEATGSIIYAARENGYRIDIDGDGIRGWEE